MFDLIRSSSGRRRLAKAGLSLFFDADLDKDGGGTRNSLLGVGVCNPSPLCGTESSEEDVEAEIEVGVLLDFFFRFGDAVTAAGMLTGRSTEPSSPVVFRGRTGASTPPAAMRAWAAAAAWDLGGLFRRRLRFGWFGSFSSEKI